MAAGFTPKFTDQLPLDNLSPEDFLVIAVDIAKKLEWNISYQSATGLIAYTNRGMFKKNAKITIKIEDSIATVKSESTGREMVDMGMNKKTVYAFIDNVNLSKSLYSKEELQQKFVELKPGLTPEENDILKLPAPTSGEKLANFFSLFKPRKGYFITPILVDINIIVFILMIISGVNFMMPDNADLLKWGANFKPLTLGGEWWRLLTNIFLHIGIIHLLFNMYALLYIGLLLEPYLGKAKFLTAYLLTGIVASVTSLAWHDLTVSAGASGAIFGLYGVFLAMLTTNLIEKATRTALLSSIAIFVGYNLLNGMKEGIDNAAHVGGLVSGLIIGYCFYPTLIKPVAVKLKYSIITALTILVLTTSFIVYKKLPNDVGVYQTNMDKFGAMEATALAIYKLPDDATKEQQLTAIADSGINNWNKSIELLNETNKLNIPASFKDRNNILLNYCNIRLNTYNLLYKQINENTDAYKDSIKSYDSQIGDIINQLKSNK